MGKHYGEKIIAEVLTMKTSGISNQEIGENFGLSIKQVNNMIQTYRHKQEKLAAGIEPRAKGRPRKYPSTEEQNKDLRIKELEREVELYKSFLHAAGRM